MTTKNLSIICQVGDVEARKNGKGIRYQNQSRRTVVAEGIEWAQEYRATVEMFRNGNIQLAWIGGLTGVQVRA